MATNLEIVRTALRRAGVLNEAQEPSAEQSRDGLEAMNDMIAAWEFDGIEMEYYPQTTISATTPIPAHTVDAVKYALAVRFSGEYGLPVPAATARFAQMTYDALITASLDTEIADMDHVPGSTRYRFDITNG